jgi:hypothetical protein
MLNMTRNLAGFFRKTLTTLVGLYVGFNSLTAFADPPPASHHYWRNTNYPSHYVLYDAKSRTWVETINCEVRYRFRAIKNELNNLTLYDDSRGMTVLVNYDGMYLKADGATNFSFYQHGTFDTREHFYHFDSAGAHTGTIARGHGCLWQEWFPGNAAPVYTFVQTTVDNGAIEMFDASRAIGVRLEMNRMLLRHGHQPFAIYKNGQF